MDNFGNATSLGGEVEKVFPLTETLPQVLREAANALAHWTLRVTGVAATPKEFPLAKNIEPQQKRSNLLRGFTHEPQPLHSGLQCATCLLGADFTGGTLPTFGGLETGTDVSGWHPVESPPTEGKTTLAVENHKKSPVSIGNTSSHWCIFYSIPMLVYHSITAPGYKSSIYHSFP